jgi:predicted Zn finger-like uncharacterized protein
VKFLCDQCKTKYQIADEKAVGKTLRMKCRKCGHLIEVRAATVATQSTPPPAPPGKTPSPAGVAPRPPAKPAAAPLASSLASARPATKSEKPGALAGAFKSTVRDDEVSTPFDMSDLSPINDEWYVAVNGVPVGPIRVAEIRRKAANGAVTEDSLAWQEGLDEWRPVRTFPDLAAAVREAIAGGRPSLTPVPPDARGSHAPAPPRTGAARASVAPRGRTHPSSGVEPAAARSNVVPISSRLATAERLAEHPDDLAIPVHDAPDPAAVADPFAAPPPRPGVADISPLESLPPRQPKKPFPWIPIAMVAGAVSFGVTAGLAAFSRPQPTQQIIYEQMPAAPGPAATETAPAGSVAAADPAQPASSGPSSKGAIAMGGGAKPAASAAAKKSNALDLGGLMGGGGPAVDPGGGETARAAGQCLSSGQVQSVVGMHQVAVRRTCWDRNPTSKPAVNVNVSLTIGADGSTQNVSSSGDEASVAKCIENDARSWRFPAMGCSQAVSIPFHFIRQ